MREDRPPGRTVIEMRRSGPDGVGAGDRSTPGIARRRRRAAAMVVLLLVVGLVSARAVGERTAGPALRQSVAGPVPWLDVPAPQPTGLPRRDPRPDARDCTPGNLGRLAWSESTTWPDRTVHTILLGNSSDTRCTLRGTATLRATDAATGRRSDLVMERAVEYGDPAQRPATIDPGEPARLDVVTGLTCPAGTEGPVRYSDLAVVLPGGPEIPVSALTVSSPCRQLTTGDWYVQPPLFNANRQVTTIEAPARVRRGTTLEYTVSLLNPSDDRLRLAPCPVYTQRLGGQATTYRLNCTVGTVAAHATVRFRMRLPVPADTPLGATRLTWMAVLAGGEVAIADLATDGVPVTVTG